MPKHKSILGETRRMKNGLMATCIKYVQWNDIDVEFEDGVIVMHKAKRSFINGEIGHPIINARVQKSSCLGEIRIMKNGQKAKCIEYKNSKNLVVQFEDGTIIPRKTKREFYMGTIGNPNVGSRITSRKSIIGQKKVMNCGLIAEVIADRGGQDIDVKFEDDFVIKHRNRADFRRGNISHPYYALRSFPQQIVLACVRKYFQDAVADYRPNFLKNMESGHNLEIDIWIPSINVGIEYDGYPWHRKETKQSFAKYKAVINSNKIKVLYSLIEKGCIEYNSVKHRNIILNVEPKTNKHNPKNLFEEIKKAMIQILKELGISNPTIVFNDEFLDNIRLNIGKEYIGKTRTMKNGQKATVIVYRNSGDIDVRFEDGTIVKHRKMQNFKEGEIKNPNYDKSSVVGLTIKMLNGLKATCVAYRNSKDIDIQFEDGIIVLHKSKSNFLNGRIAHPNYNPYNQNKRSIVGETRMMNCGMKATCIVYRSFSDLDVRFEDGTIVNNRTKGQFYKGNIKHPNLKK